MTGDIILRGCAIRFGEASRSRDPRPMIAQAGCFSLLLDRTRLLFNHDPSKAFAWVGDRSLRVFQNDEGLFFEAVLRDEPRSRGLAQGVYNGTFTEVSVLFGAHRRSTFEPGKDGRDVECVAWSRLPELSIVQTGTAAQPNTAVWTENYAGTGRAANAAPASARLAWKRADAAGQARTRASRGDGATLCTVSSPPPSRHGWSKHSPEQLALNRRLLALIDSPEWHWGAEQQRQAAAAMRGTQR